MTHPNADGDWYKNKLRPLLGSEVVGIYQDEDGFLCIVCEKDDVTYHLWLFSDDEGNYPGSFDLQTEEDSDQLRLDRYMDSAGWPRVND